MQARRDHNTGKKLMDSEAVVSMKELHNIWCLGDTEHDDIDDMKNEQVSLFSASLFLRTKLT